jgi:hypothetical protein
MPGRRGPRRPPEQQAAEQARTIFPSGADGASAVAAPVRREERSRLRGERPGVLFGYDLVFGTGRQRHFNTRFMPIRDSLRVYVGDMYVAEGPGGWTWATEPGDVRCTIVLDSAPEAWHRVQLVYAYLEGSVRSIMGGGHGEVFPEITWRSLGGWHQEGETAKWPYWHMVFPRATGFPVRLLQPEPWSPWLATQWDDVIRFSWQGAHAETFSSPYQMPREAPPLSPRSQRSMAFSPHVPNGYTGGRFNVRSTGQEPYWKTATRLKVSFMMRHVPGTAAPTAFYFDVFLKIPMAWYEPAEGETATSPIGGSYDSDSVYYELYRDAAAGTWSVDMDPGRIDPDYWVSEQGASLFRCDPFDGQPHLVVYEIDCAARTWTASIDDESRTYPGSWPEAERLALSQAAYPRGMLTNGASSLSVEWTYAYSGAPGGEYVLIDDFTVETDVQWVVDQVVV